MNALGGVPTAHDCRGEKAAETLLIVAAFIRDASNSFSRLPFQLFNLSALPRSRPSALLQQPLPLIFRL